MRNYEEEIKRLDRKMRACNIMLAICFVGLLVIASLQVADAIGWINLDVPVF